MTAAADRGAVVRADAQPLGWLPLALLMLLALLAGCAGNQRPEGGAPDAAWQRWQAQATAVDSFHISGKLGIRVTAGSGGGGSASLEWDQLDDRYRLVLVAPLGRGSIYLTGDADSAEVVGGDSSEVVRGDPEQALAARLGWSLPVHALRWWARGLPQPGARVQRLEAADGRTSLIEQRGWRVEPGRWQPVTDAAGQALDLPHRLVLEGPEARLVLVVRGWQMPVPEDDFARDQILN